MGLSNYNGSVTLISGIRQANNGTFPLLEANAVQVDDDGTRLDEKLAELEGIVVHGLSTAQINMLEKIFNHIAYIDTEAQSTVDEFIQSLRGATDIDVDSIVQDGNVLTIYSLANAPAQNENTLVIA